MKIGIDARLYGTKHRGLGRYVQKLVDGLIKADQQNEFVLFLTAENFDLIKVNNPRIKKVLLNAKWYSFKEQYLAPIKIKKERVELMHFPHFNVPLVYQQKFIVTVHDLIIKHFPDSRATTLPNWWYQLKLKGFAKVLQHAIYRAEEIIVPSNFVKQDILQNYKISEEKIKIIYEGYFFEDQLPLAEISRFNISKPFILYVGAAYPHKNLERLVKVFEKLNKNKKYQLVLVGQQDYFYQRLKQVVNFNQDIIFTGYIEETELISLYTKACLYIFPSLYEGFGLPPLEAQAYRLPVISSNRSALPEILQDSALYFNPENEEEMLTQIQSVLTDNKLRQQLINKGLVNIKRFSWQKMIEEILSLYRKI